MICCRVYRITVYRLLNLGITQKTANIRKTWYHSAVRWHLADVVLRNVSVLTDSCFSVILTALFLNTNLQIMPCCFPPVGRGERDAAHQAQWGRGQGDDAGSERRIPTLWRRRPCPGRSYAAAERATRCARNARAMSASFSGLLGSRRSALLLLFFWCCVQRICLFIMVTRTLGNNNNNNSGATACYAATNKYSKLSANHNCQSSVHPTVGTCYHRAVELVQWLGRQTLKLKFIVFKLLFSCFLA